MNKDHVKCLECPDCGGNKLKKLISQISYHVSEDIRIDSFDPNVPKDYSFCQDSRNIGLSAKKRAKQMGVDLGKGFEEKLEKLRTDPGSILRDHYRLKREKTQ